MTDFVLDLWYNLGPWKPLQNPPSDFWMMVSVSNYQTNQVGIIQNSGLSLKYKYRYRYRYSLSHVLLFETPWTVAYQVPPLMGFSRQEYWSGLPFSSPNKLIDFLKKLQKKIHFIPHWWTKTSRERCSRWLRHA